MTMNELVMSYCPSCGAPHKLFAICKTCGVAAVRGTMGEMNTIQSTYAAAHAPPPPSAEEIARAEEAARYAAEVRAAASEARRASLAKTTRQTSRAPWQRPCTCGHCMSCIGE